MQLSLTFPDSGHPDVLFIVTKDSLAKDALEAAAKEWLVDPLFIELSLLRISYCGTILSLCTRLLSEGVVADSELTVSLFRCIGKELLTDDSTRGKVGKLIEKGSFGSDRILYIDTPTFTDDAGCLDFKNEWIPEGVLNICFANPNPSVTSTAPDLLRSSNLTSIDLLGLQYVTSVGDLFLYDCRSLKTVDLCLQNVSSIGSHFLNKCSLLEVVDFGSFEKVTVVNTCFLSDCSSLKTISNISGLRNVKSIGIYFLSSCSSLVSVDLSVFTSVESIGSYFLDGCKMLENVDLRSFTKVTSIRVYFMCGCSSLSTISNISGLRNVENITTAWNKNTYFLYGCSSLAPIDASVPGYECLSEEMKKEFEELK